MHMDQLSDNSFIIGLLQESDMWHLTVSLIVLSKVK